MHAKLLDWRGNCALGLDTIFGAGGDRKGNGRHGNEAVAPSAYPGYRSEVELCGKLQATGVKGRGHLSEVPIRKARIDITELSVVEGIERFEPQFKSRARLVGC
jgi:hypothetical protein